MNWISNYLIRNKSKLLSKELLNKLESYSDVRQSLSRMLGNFYINNEIYQNEQYKSVYIYPKTAEIKKSKEIYLKLENNRNNILHNKYKITNLDDGEFEKAFNQDCFLIGIEIWMATVSINFCPENENNVLAIWAILEKSKDLKSRTIVYFKEILSNQNNFLPFTTSRVFVEEAYDLNPVGLLNKNSHSNKSNLKSFLNGTLAFRYNCENFDSSILENEHVYSLVVDCKKYEGIVYGGFVINSNPKLIPIFDQFNNDIDRISNYILNKNILELAKNPNVKNPIEKYNAIFNPRLKNIQRGDFVLSIFTLETYLAIAHVEQKLQPEIDLIDNSWIIDE
jgi:hypothetical protein